MLVGFILAHAASIDGIKPKLEQLGVATDAAAENIQTPTFRSKRFHEQIADQQKYITFPTTGWTNGVVHWRYNDSGRMSGVASAAAMITLIQTEQAKWTAACNVQFIYDGSSSNPPSLVTSSSFDGVNVIGWAAQQAPQTGETGIGWALPEPGPIVEGDIELNNTFNPDIGKTLLHELGHMLGLQHSNVANVVMSGPPQTSYVSLSTLQPDDIAGCQYFYGAPASSKTISGIISNGSAIADVTFCARPATGVSCTASNGSGAYSCAVPNGWNGILHAAAPAGLRIKPQSFTNVRANLSNQNPVVQSIGACNLDVDNNGLIEPATDGVAILRRMLGFSASAFAGLSDTCAGNATAATVYAATASNYNATGGGATRSGTDGLVILRAMQGLTGSAVTDGLGLARESGATNTTWPNIRNNFLNSTCSADFLP